MYIYIYIISLSYLLFTGNIPHGGAGFKPANEDDVNYRLFFKVTMAEPTLMEPNSFQVTGFPCAHRYRLRKDVYTQPKTNPRDILQYLNIQAGPMSVN